MFHRNYFSFSLMVLFLLVLTACGGAEVAEETAAPEGGLSAVGAEDGGGSPHDPGSLTKAVTRPGAAGWIDESGAGAAVERAIEAGSPVAREESEEVAVRPASAEPMVEGTRVTADAAVEFESETPAESPLTLDQNSRLTAGDVDDNVHWDDYLLYRREYSGARVLDVDISTRHQIWVRESTGMPVLGAVLKVSNGGQEVATLRTHSDGRAYFFPSALPAGQQEGPFEVEVTAPGRNEILSIDAGTVQREWFVDLEPAAAISGPTRLDVLFLIDATGSMADEIQQLKDNIRAVSARIDELPGNPNVRFGMTVYRDRGDLFTSRTFEFTPDVEFFAEGLAQVEADGGGDYPEDLNEGLYKAINVPEWRIEDTVSLIFLVADAPPHLDYEDQEYDYAGEMRRAAARGIKIYPIASSGLDEQGEYVFRQLAQYTGGRFLFLTYGAGGAGTTGTETDHNVEGYDVTSLDGLVVKIIEEELAYRLPIQ